MTDKEIEEIQIKIKKSRDWALNHFNAKEAKNTNLINLNTLELVKPSFFVLFPEPDEMDVSPSILGKAQGIWIHYRLYFCKDGSIEWHGVHPFSLTLLPPLKVEEV